MSLSEFLSLLESRTHCTPKKAGTGSEFTCRCPAHDDKSPSLSIAEGAEGKILLKCHAGCELGSITAALGISPRDLFPGTTGKRRGRPRNPANIAQTYSYRDERGVELFQVCRLEPKSFRQRRAAPGGSGEWCWDTKGTRQVPYRLPELIAAVKAGELIIVAEGEKDVEALVKMGFAATCNAGGAGKWRDGFGQYFDGAHEVVVIADKDAVGRAHAVAIAQELKPLVRSIKVVELPDVGVKPVKDSFDYFEAGGTVEEFRAIIAQVPQFIPKLELTPGAWFKQRFPRLAEMYGEPIHETLSGNRARVRDISEDFMAATLGLDGRPEAPTVYLALEDRFYTYNPLTGVFERQREDEIAAKMSTLFLECAKESRETADVSKLEFAFRDSAALAGIIRRAKGILGVGDEFFVTDNSEFLPVANGMLRLSDRALLPFSPSYRCRHKLGVAYNSEARAPKFMEILLKPALDAGDISLIQRWSGLALIGVNLSQKILLLTGTAGGGKSTLVSVVTGIIGIGNVGLLRTEFLNDRFELGRLLGKTLLYGPDVAEDFLSKRTASCLKSLSGGDVMTAEFKNSNESPEIKCQFNMIMTSNSRLTVYLEGDAEAWRRRMLVVRYERGKPDVPIPNLAELIVSEEGSGVLNFMLDGLDALRRNGWQLPLSDRQQARVDDLLLESDSHGEFVRNCLVKDSSASGMTKSEVYTAYVEFCERREWIPLPKPRFGKLGPEVISQEFGLSVRGDIFGPDGKQNDGWKSLRLRVERDGTPQTSTPPF